MAGETTCADLVATSTPFVVHKLISLASAPADGPRFNLERQNVGAVLVVPAIKLVAITTVRQERLVASEPNTLWFHDDNYVMGMSFASLETIMS